MGQNNSMDDQHLDHPNTPFARGQTPNQGQQQQQQQQSSHNQQQLQQQQQSQQPQPPRREDSGNDFAMSIAEGGHSNATVGGSTPTASNQGNSAMHDGGTAQQVFASPTPTQPKIETVPTAFKWVHGGNEVYVTGSFNNWQGKILMYPNEDNEFTLLIDIPPGTHHYKYIVDQEWRLDEDAPTVQIANVWNNVVEVKRPVFEYTPANFADSDDDEDERKQKAAYGQRAPLSNDYVNDPPKLPPHLTDILLNQTQPQDPMMLPVPLHVVLNHLYVMQNTDPSVLVTGLTQRFKPNPHTKITHKFVTTVYYAPKSSFNSPPTGFQSSPMLGPSGMVPSSVMNQQVQPSPTMRQNFMSPAEQQQMMMEGVAPLSLGETNNTADSNQQRR